MPLEDLKTVTMGAIDGREAVGVVSHPESDESEASPLSDTSESVRAGTIEGTASAGDIRAMVANEVGTAATVMVLWLFDSTALKSETIFKSFGAKSVRCRASKIST